VAVLGLALIAACSGPAGVETTTSTLAPVSTSTTAASTSTTATSPLTTSTSTPATSPPTTAPDDGASGSGCTPGDAVTLPEGEWFGLVVSTSPTGIVFDLACWFTGEAAIDAAAEDGEESPPPNDYYVRNENPQTRSLAVSAEALVVWYPTGDPASETEVSFQEWADEVVGRGFMFGVWLDVIDGEVLGIREQWVP
jgi:hypothetical protein